MKPSEKIAAAEAAELAYVRRERARYDSFGLPTREDVLFARLKAVIEYLDSSMEEDKLSSQSHKETCVASLYSRENE